MSDHDVNRVVLTGRIDGEPEMRYTPAGEPYTTFFITSVGTSITGTQRTEQFRLLARGDPLAERCSELAPKTRLLVVGHLHYCSSDNEADCIRFPLEVCVEQVMPFGTSPDARGPAVLAPGPRGPAPGRAVEHRIGKVGQPSRFPGIPRPMTIVTSEASVEFQAIELAELPL